MKQFLPYYMHVAALDSSFFAFCIFQPCTIGKTPLIHFCQPLIAHEALILLMA